MPERESLDALARHHCSLCIFLWIAHIDAMIEALRRAGWADSAPMVVVKKATWPGEERALRGKLFDIAEQCRAAGIDRQAMILGRPALGGRARTDIEVS